MENPGPECKSAGRFAGFVQTLARKARFWYETGGKNVQIVPNYPIATGFLAGCRK